MENDPNNYQPSTLPTPNAGGLPPQQPAQPPQVPGQYGVNPQQQPTQLPQMLPPQPQGVQQPQYPQATQMYQGQPPVQTPQPMQPAMQQAQPAAMNLDAQGMQDTMRKSILKIIVVMSAISIAFVLFLFMMSSSIDESLGSTSQVSNNQANYSVPTSWTEDTQEEYTAYYNADSLSGSQATMVVSRPSRVSFDQDPLTDSELETIANSYRRTVNEGEDSIQLGEAEEVEQTGFYKSYQFEITGLADDGITEIRGVSRVMYDANNFAHTIEFVSVRSYWEANKAEVIQLLDTYSSKGD